MTDERTLYVENGMVRMREDLEVKIEAQKRFMREQNEIEAQKRLAAKAESEAKEQARRDEHKDLRAAITVLNQECIAKRRELYAKRIELAYATCPLRPGDVFSTKGWQATGVYQAVQVVPDEESPDENDWAILCRRYNKLGQLGSSVVKIQSRNQQQDFTLLPNGAVDDANTYVNRTQEVSNA